MANNPMTRKILPALLLFLTVIKSGAAVVVTYRGDAPNVITPFAAPSGNDLDINGDEIADFRFHSDGSFVAAIKSYGNNQFISTLAVPPDQGGYAIPVQAGSIIGTDLTILGGDWHHHTDNVSNPSLSTGFGLGAMQYVSAYIGVSFQTDDGTHYGWIHYIGFDSPDNDYFLPDVPGGFINAWAWETEPGRPIVAGAVPEPSTLPLLLIAAISGACWRRRM